jgi:hypothetical protein
MLTHLYRNLEGALNAELPAQEAMDRVLRLYPADRRMWLKTLGEDTVLAAVTAAVPEDWSLPSLRGQMFLSELYGLIKGAT